jgi:carboxymethylenebutenolidase
METVAVSDRSSMDVYVATPKGAANGGGILVFQEAFGVNAYIRDIADRFAALGFTAVAPELFHRTGPGFEGAYDNFEPIKPHMAGLSTQGIAADASAAFDFLTKQPGVDATRIASIGFCMGGRASFIANSEVKLRAAISFYGGGMQELLDLVPKQHGPLLTFWGGKDQHILPEYHRAVSDALAAAGKTHEKVVFSQADHGFFCDQRSAYEPGSAAQAWALVQAFLRAFGMFG